MSYFRELPNFEYISNFPNQSFNDDYTITKNLFKRAKLRDDIANAVTVFEYYQIIDNERPDQVAQKVYNDPSLDWVILISNNVTNLNDQWPLDNNSLYKYLLDKYGDDETIAQVHHYETIEVRDSFDRLIIPGGLQVDPQKTISVTTNTTDTEYNLSEFPSADTDNVITINLNQFVRVFGNYVSNENTDAIVKDIETNKSFLQVKARDTNTPISIINTLSNWPNSWGGSFSVVGRNSISTTIQVGDVVFDNDVVLDPSLYEIVGELQDGKVVPVFKFLPQS
jgi:hypothetical protein